ncbi:MAG: hypothetical protein ACKOZT_15070 [Cyanobium sp.]
MATQHIPPALTLLAAGLCAGLVLNGGQAGAVMVVNVVQQPGGVLFQASGSFAALPTPISLNPEEEARCEPTEYSNLASSAFLCIGSQAALLKVYEIAPAGPGNFSSLLNLQTGFQTDTGANPLPYPSSDAGLAIALCIGCEGAPPTAQLFGLDESYVLDNPITGSTLFAGLRFADLGISEPGLIGEWTLAGTSETVRLVATYPVVPAPLPLLGAAAATGWGRALRRRIRRSA